MIGLIFGETSFPLEILNKIKERNSARKRKNFKLADKIRNELTENGILIEDKDDTTTWKYKWPKRKYLFLILL